MILAASFTLQCGSTIRSAHRKLRKVTVRGIEILTVLLLGVSKYEDQPFLTLLHFLEPVETPIYIPRIWNCQDDNFGLAMSSMHLAPWGSSPSHLRTLVLAGPGAASLSRSRLRTFALRQNGLCIRQESLRISLFHGVHRRSLVAGQ